MRKTIFLLVAVPAIGLFFLLNTKQVYAVKPSDHGLKEGDLISAIFSNDPDVYIINQYGYKRLFLNPEIFKFYGHLGGFMNVKLVAPEVRDAFPTSGLFRDCEMNDPKVYGVEVSGEDTGKLRWVDVSANSAVADDPEFFHKVFCINQQEFSWYPKSAEFKSVKDVPKYERANQESTATSVEQVSSGASLKNIGQVVICHYPPGNSSAANTIIVDASALKVHLAHGDTVGACPVATPTITPTSMPSITPTPTSTAVPTPVPSPTLVSTPTPVPTATPSARDTTPRIMYWWGKVNQHTDAYGNWLTDPDGVSGADLDKLTYCKKFYPNTIGVEDYMLETTNTWRNRGNVDGPFTSIKMSTKCLQQGDNHIIPTPTPTPTPSISSGPSATPTPTPTLTPTPTSTPSPTPSPTPIPALTPSPTPTSTPAPTSVTAPTNITIGWYKGFNGQPPAGIYQLTIGFSYPAHVSDVQLFRLYLKRPGESSFSAVATFASPASIDSTCNGYISSGTYRMRNCTTSGGGYWQIFSQSGRSSLYATGEYDAYLTAVNGSGVEGPASSTAKNIVSKTAILGPIGVQNSLTPQFRWAIPNNWPGGLFSLQVYDGTNYVWGYGGFSIAAGTVEGSYTYNGPPLSQPYFGPVLSTSKTYYVNIWAEGHDGNGTRYFSMSDSDPSFTVAAPSPTPTPTPSPISCAPITVSISPATPSQQNVSAGQGGVSLAIFNVAANCYLNLNSFAVSLLPMPNGYQNISSLRLYNNTTGAQLGSTVAVSGAGLNFTGLNQLISPEQTLSLKAVGDISPSAVNGSTVYAVFGGSSAADAAGAFVGNNASGNIIAGNVMTVVAPLAGLDRTKNLAIFSRNLTVGSTGDDVRHLQALLINEVGYPVDLITGYFGRITQDAVKRLQEKFNVTPVSGYFGEITRGALSALMPN
jgi:hypothetical protein